MEKIKFNKYQGCGNDFIILDEKQSKKIGNIKKFCQKICDRNFGIGADGLIFPSQKDGYFVMNYYNSDGSYANMCGNGMRCFVRYLLDNNYQIKDNKILIAKGFVLIKAEQELISVNMGMFGEISSYSLEDFEVLYTKMHVDHCMIFGAKLPKNFKIIGKKIENNPIFKNKTNVNFVQVINETELNVTTWERGAGYTLACGSGVCSSCVCYVVKNPRLVNKKLTVNVPGGIMYVSVTKNKNVIMSGPAQKIARGIYYNDLNKEEIHNVKN